MPSQLPHVNCKYGAPMGRWTSPSRKPAGRTVRLFRVILDAGGYDQGGAYWGLGARLYCATDDRDYQDFVRASSRAAAAVALGITDRLRRGAGRAGGASC
jgi:hypothetical protein